MWDRYTQTHNKMTGAKGRRCKFTYLMDTLGGSWASDWCSESEMHGYTHLLKWNKNNGFSQKMCKHNNPKAKGLLTDYWDVIWVGNVSQKAKYPGLYRVIINKNSSSTSTMCDWGLVLCLSFRSLVGPKSTEYEPLLGSLCNVFSLQEWDRHSNLVPFLP